MDYCSHMGRVHNRWAFASLNTHFTNR
ncbi:uncharacterized protein METZ01_LOCUS474400, partial [marine metagenome]